MLTIYLTLCVLLPYGVSDVDVDRHLVLMLTVKEGASVTLPTNAKINQKDRIKWFFQNTRIAQVLEHISSCTDVQCNEGTERFRDRLKLDLQTGSLTISDIQPADSGLYELQIISSITNTDSLKIFNVTVSGAEVSVMEGDSVTLYTGVQTNQQYDIKWYFNGIPIAQINGDLSKFCTDVQCNEGTERFRDRLKLDHQTGSLTIMNIINTHSGLYELNIINSRVSVNIFNVSVHVVSAAERDEVKRKSVKEGEYVAFDPGVKRKPSDVMMWYFNDILIAEITGDQSQICTDDQCKERFRDRLKLDNQTGSLTITYTRNTHSGLYKLLISIINSTFSITRVKRFSVSVIDVRGSGLSPGAVAGIVVSVLLLVSVVVGAAGAVIYYRHHKRHAEVPQDEGDADNPPADPNAIPLENMEYPGDADNLRPDPSAIPVEASSIQHPDSPSPPLKPPGPAPCAMVSFSQKEVRLFFLNSETATLPTEEDNLRSAPRLLVRLKKSAATHALFSACLPGPGASFIKLCVGSFLKVYVRPKAKNGVRKKIFRLIKLFLRQNLHKIHFINPSQRKNARTCVSSPK